MTAYCLLLLLINESKPQAWYFKRFDVALMVRVEYNKLSSSSLVARTIHIGKDLLFQSQLFDGWIVLQEGTDQSNWEGIEFEGYGNLEEEITGGILINNCLDKQPTYTYLDQPSMSTIYLYLSTRIAMTAIQ